MSDDDTLDRVNGQVQGKSLVNWPVHTQHAAIDVWTPTSNRPMARVKSTMRSEVSIRKIRFAVGCLEEVAGGQVLPDEADDLRPRDESLPDLLVDDEVEVSSPEARLLILSGKMGCAATACGYPASGPISYGQESQGREQQREGSCGRAAHLDA